MRRTAAIATTASLLLVLTAACDVRSQSEEPEPEPTASPTAPIDVAEHESGPESPIAFGLQVPDGATQLGPLVRLRSDQLIAAYQPELDAAQAQSDAVDAERRAEAEEEGEPIPTETTPPPTQPGRDSFALVENPPRPDTTVSVMRIDGDPTETLRRMIVQLNAIVPSAALVTDDIGEYCAAEERRITSCTLQVRGETPDRRDVRITVTVDPGDLATRTARASSQGQPVMTAVAEYVGDPRSGQVERENEPIEVPSDVEGEDRSDLIWPQMDEESPTVEGLPQDWEVPVQTTVLLNGTSPTFVATASDRVRQADDLAEQFASSVGEPRVDVVEDLNEITTTYRSESSDGDFALAVYVLSARGNYAMLFYTPQGEAGPGAEGPIEPLE